MLAGKGKTYFVILLVTLFPMMVAVPMFSQPASYPLEARSLPVIEFTPPTVWGKAARLAALGSASLLFTPGQKVLEWWFRGMEPVTLGERYQGSHPGWEQTKRVGYLAMAVLSLPVALPATLLGSVAYSLLASLSPKIYAAPPIGSRSLSKGGGLSVMTYNTALTHAFVCAYTYMRPCRERVARIAENLIRDDPDVICLQECLWETEGLTTALTHRGYHVFRDVALNPFGSESGLITASKFPVEGARFYPIGHYVGVEALSQRGLFEVLLRLPSGRKVAVYNLHLQSGGNDPKVVEARAAQVAAVYEVVSRRLEEDEELSHAIIAGDWNIAERLETGELAHTMGPSPVKPEQGFDNVLYMARWEERLSRVDTQGRKIRVAWDDQPGTLWDQRLGKGWGTSQGNFSLKEVEGCNPDHILYKGNMKLCEASLRLDYGDCSDHFPLVANFQLDVNEENL